MSNIPSPGCLTFRLRNVVASGVGKRNDVRLRLTPLADLCSPPTGGLTTHRLLCQPVGGCATDCSVSQWRGWSVEEAWSGSLHRLRRCPRRCRWLEGLGEWPTVASLAPSSGWGWRLRWVRFALLRSEALLSGLDGRKKALKNGATHAQRPSERVVRSTTVEFAVNFAKGFNKGVEHPSRVEVGVSLMVAEGFLHTRNECESGFEVLLGDGVRRVLVLGVRGQVCDLL